MESFYRLENIHFPDNDEIIILIRDNDSDIHEMYIKPVHYHNQSKYYLYAGRPICKSNPNKNINEYFFNENKQYKKESYKLTLLHEIIGFHYPRIYRPVLKNDTLNSNAIYFSRGTQNLYNNFHNYDYIHYDEKILLSSVQQLSILINRIENIFKSVNPCEANLFVFGHEIRNVLILACTEVESQLKGILISNDIYPLNKKEYTTKDYVKLLDHLKLKAYTIELAYFPELNSISPFKGWNEKNPSESLSWYNAYNAVKHDRENNFEKATLQNAINAISAMCVLLLAQYGSNIPYWKDLIGNFFEINSKPSWHFRDCYIPPYAMVEWEKAKLDLNKTISNTV